MFTNLNLNMKIYTSKIVSYDKRKLNGRNEKEERACERAGII